MKQRIICKTLAVAVILLFLGLAIQPSVAVQPETTDIEDDCNLCAKKVSKHHLVLIQSITRRLETYSNQILNEFKDEPEIRQKCQEISDNIALLRDIKLGWDFPIICTTLALLISPIAHIWTFLFNLIIKYEYNKFIYIVLIIFTLPLDLLLMNLLGLNMLFCYEPVF